MNWMGKVRPQVLLAITALSLVSVIALLKDGNGDMVAVGRLSTPIKKNFTSEATIKVKLSY